MIAVASIALSLWAGCGGDGKSAVATTSTPTGQQSRPVDLAGALQQPELGTLETPEGFTPTQRTDAYAFAGGANPVYQIDRADVAPLSARLKKNAFVAGAIHYYGPLPYTTSTYVPNGFMSLVQFRGAAGAKADAGEQHRGTLKPCPDRCALKASEFSVEGIPGTTSGAAATRQVNGSLTIQEYSVVFTKGSVVAQVYANAKVKDAAGLKDTVVTAARSLFATLP